MSEHTHHEQLLSELENAQQCIEVGALYRHYKAATAIYRVLSLAFIENTMELSVVYITEADSAITYVRPLQSWIEVIEHDGEAVARFTKLEEQKY